ncbi:MAG TPA: PQQ-dependent sugar dehydrogenase, partial [Chloroflexota bacterium]|nr:PQQ-dependent sugar dehydrogenase [Chloroflexota bacterium]
VGSEVGVGRDADQAVVPIVVDAVADVDQRGGEQGAVLDGLVKVVKNGALLPTPLIDIRDRVNDYWDHGLIGIAAHPNFTTNPYVYLMYTYENNPGDYSGRKTGRLARYTVSGDTADPASETVLLGTQVGESCNLFPAGADCIPSDSPSHSVGSLKFAADGTLFVSLGDGAHFNLVDDDALRAQNLDLLAGKLLRITADGQGVPGGPFWNGSGAANRSKVWGLGLRNPYRFTLRPLAGGGTGLPYLGDVGWNTWEEINVPPAGANMGWPCYEGTARQSGYEPKSVCQALYAQGSGAVKAPLVSWDHSAGSSAATGGAFYTGTSYPAAYQGAYVYGDYGQNWMRSLRVDGDNILVSGPTDFATDAQGPVAIEAGPDGDLHYLAIVAGQLRRVRYTGGSDPVSCTTGQYRAEYFNNRTLSGSPAFTRCETSISYDWGGGGPGFGVGPDNFSVRWTGRHQLDAGNYTFTARADDGIRLWLDGALLIDAWYDQPVTTYTASRTVTGGEHEVKVEYYENGGGAIAQVSWAPSTNQSPAATITSPAPALRFKVGDVIAFSGSATDAEDGTVPASRLTWEVRLHHCPAFGPSCHAHLFTTATGTGGTITAPDHGDGSYFEFVLTATDSAGLTDTESVSVQPQTVQLTLATAPSGLEVVYDGTAGVAPLTRTTIVGSSHTIQVSSPQGGLVFVSWSDGGAMQHNVTAGAADTTYTATFASPTATPTAPPGPTPSATPSMSPTATTTATATTPSPTPTRTPVVTATPTLTPTPGAPGGAHVGDLDGAATGTRNEWTARVTVAIHDAAENPVAGATVQGSWSSGQPAGASCTTDSAGRCSVTSGSIPRRTDRVTFTVTGVSHTLPYAAAGNHDPDGDSDGTRVTVVKP